MPKARSGAAAFGEALLSRLERGEYTSKVEATGEEVLTRSESNTNYVLSSLTAALLQAGFISSAIALSFACERFPLDDNKEKEDA